MGFYPTRADAEAGMANTSLTSAYYWVWVEALEEFLDKAA